MKPNLINTGEKMDEESECKYFGYCVESGEDLCAECEQERKADEEERFDTECAVGMRGSKFL